MNFPINKLPPNSKLALEQQTDLPEKISVLLVDDHSLFRGGVAALLQKQKNINLVGEAGDALDGLAQAKKYCPDVILLDLNMPGVSGIAILPSLISEVPNTKIIMLTVSEDDEDLITTLQQGAHGYLLKNIDSDFLLNSIIKAAKGDSVLSPQMTSKLMERMRNVNSSAISNNQNAISKISPREREILVYLAHGMSNKEIARKLNLAESTVKIHIQHILKKLAMTSRVQAAVFAVEQGMV